jgi:hypothetical protein
MKKKELIEALSKYDDNTEVLIEGSESGYDEFKIKFKTVGRVDDAKLITKDY